MNSKDDIIGLETNTTRELNMTCSLSKKEILQKIIKEDGSCEWIIEEFTGQDVCRLCPFNTLKKKDEYNFFCCYEAVNGATRPLNEVEEYKRYRETAIQLLVDMVVQEELLGQDPEDFKSEVNE